MVVCATGFFDGVHEGHKAILEALKEKARAAGKKSAVVTFWPHPRIVLQQDASQLRLLTTLEEKRKLILDQGIDYFHVVPFTLEFSHLTTAEFIRQYLVEKFHVSEMIIGYDHRLGSDGVQTQEQLINIAASCGVQAYTVDEYILPHHMKVSSTRVRRALSEGDILDAGILLGYPYRIEGTVVQGNHIGRTIGFPTANILPKESLKLIPKNGVYVVTVEVNGRISKGICNIGTRPTVSDTSERTIETYILDFNENIYGQDLILTFCSRIRPEQKFGNLEELRQQLKRDEESARNYGI